MVEEIEADLQTARAVGDERGREPACVDVECRVPRMVDPRRAGEPMLADDLGVEVQGGACLAPRFVRNSGPRGAHVFLHSSWSADVLRLLHRATRRSGDGEGSCALLLLL